MLYYSKSTGGFYSTEIHGDDIPTDAVHVTAEIHSSMLAGQSEGKVISANEYGLPILVDLPPPQPNAALADPVAKLRLFLAANPDVAALIES